VSAANPSPGGAPLRRVSIIGLGLMGGSLAMALRRAHLAEHITGCGRAVLCERGIGEGFLDAGTQSATEAASAADYVFLCTPVETSLALLEQIAPCLREGALVSDVGSTKQSFAAAARRIFGSRAAARVLPGHPLAGRELSGLEHASADLYEGCLWVLTPLEESPSWTPPQQALVGALEGIGARVVRTTPAEHDRVLAYTSHLPQMLSTALALTLAETFEPGDAALAIHAGGLRTMLRLASSEPKMWEQIAASNRDNIAAALEQMEAVLGKMRQTLGQPEFRAEFERAREFAKFLKG
jgi:prephenate dehydrogenase